MCAVVALTFGAALLTFAGGESGGGGGNNDCCQRDKNRHRDPGSPTLPGGCYNPMGSIGGNDDAGDRWNPGRDGFTPQPVCTPIACVSAANMCGVVSTGTQGCGSGCSASVPANPSGACSIGTVCGVNVTGTNGCAGCIVTRYPFCKSATNLTPGGGGGENGGSGGDGTTDTITWITVDDRGLGGDGSGSAIGAADITADVFVSPNLVPHGTPTVVRWLSTEATACTVEGSNGDSWSGVFGEEISSLIVQETIYTITCTAFDNSTITDTAQVRIVPIWQEF